MAYLFEVTVSNSVNDQTQNVPGKFGTNTGSSFAPAVCQAGTLCIKNGLIPSEGYEDFEILNGNTWYFNATTANVIPAGMTGDHTGIYAFNNYDVNKATDAAGNSWNVGANTLGISLPSGERGDFTELRVGEQYTWGTSNFTAAVSTNKYATIAANGQWTPAASAPSTSGVVYGEILRTKNINEGTSFVDTGYVMVIKRAAVSAGA